MKLQLKRYTKTIKDLAYSFLAYALPTMVLQFAVQPLIAARVDADANGLFLSLYNAIKLCISVLIAPLANARLLHKKNCIEDRSWDKGYNMLLGIVALLASGIMIAFSLFYRGVSASAWDYLRLIAVTVLLCAHDFYYIAFRVEINYKNILIDNALIVLGYGAGLALFWQFGCWEYVFISGYAIGTLFVLCKTDIWRAGIGFKAIKNVLPKYMPLCAASGLGRATTYCDRLLIYPVIGGYAVSVYNAAAVVSKIISIVTVPVRNVLLSYIVDKDKIEIKKKQLQKIAVLTLVAVLPIFGCFYFASAVFCKLLYPQYFADALQYVPYILGAMILDTGAAALNVVLMRFSKASLQIWTAVVKITIYLASIFLLTGLLEMGLLGFCLAILFADGARFILVLYHFMKNITVKNDLEEKEDV